MTNGGRFPRLCQHDVEYVLSGHENVPAQTIGNYREDFLEGLAEGLGAHRLRFASSFPLIDSRLEIRRIRWSPLDEARAQILAGNADRFLQRK